MKSPFKLLDAYDLQDRDNFFGRDEEIEALYDMVFKTPLLLVFGLSGTGKTSLIRCGLASRYTGPNWYPFFVHRGININESTQKSLSQVIPAEYAQTHSSLKDKVAFIFSHYLRPVYLIFDQFEELFIKGTVEEQQEFAVSLRALLEAQLPCKVILVIREEFIGRMYLLEKEVPTLFDFRLRVEPMGSKKIQEVVSASFQRFNIELQNPEHNLPRIYARISDEQSGLQFQLPYLQVFLDMLWQDDFKRTYPTPAEQKNWEQRALNPPHEYPPLFLETQELDTFGSIENVLARFLRQCEQDILNAFSQHYPTYSAQNTVRGVLDAFVTERGTKIPVPAQFHTAAIHIDEEQVKKFPAVSAEALSFVLNKLLAARLLRQRDDTLELAHDSLAALINQERSDEQRRINGLKVRLSSAYHEFVASERKVWPSQYLIASIKEYLSELQLNPELVQFFKDSQAEIRRKNRKAILIGALIAGIAVFVLSIFLGISKKNEALADLTANALIQSKTDPTAAILTLKKARHLDSDHPIVESAFHSIYSENEFYLRTLYHPDLVKGIAIVPNSKDLFSWTNHQISHWSWRGQKLDSMLTTNGINNCIYDAAQKMLAYCDDKGYLHLLRAFGLQEYKTVRLSERSIQLIAISTSSTALFYKTQDDEGFSLCKISLDRPSKVIQRLHFSSNEEPSTFAEHPVTKQLWVGFRKGKVAVYDANFHLLKTQQPHYDQVLSFAFSPDHKDVASVDRNGKMYLWKAGVGIQAHERRINKVSWSPDGSRLFTCSRDYTVKTWSPQGSLYSVYRGHTSTILGMALSTNGQHFATSSEDQTVRLWKTESKVLRHYGPHQNGARAFILFPEQQLIISGSDQGENDFGELMNDPNVDQNELVERVFSAFPRKLSVWNQHRNSVLRELSSHQAGITALARSRNGLQWTSADKSGDILLWDNTTSKQPSRQLKGHTQEVKKLVFSADGTQLLSCGEDGLIVHHLRLGTNQSIALKEPCTGIASLANGDWIIGGENHLQVYDGQSFKPKYHIPLEGSSDLSIATFCCSPDEQYLLIGENNEKIHLYTLKGQRIQTFSILGENKTGAQSIHALAFSKDSKRFAAAGEGGLAIVYQLVDGRAKEIRTVQHYPKKTILQLEFSPDGKYLYSGSNDGWLRCWNLLL
jgi:WD40 repeat protein